MTRPLSLACLSLLALAARPARAAEPDPVEFFEKNVRPLLVEKCVSCHGPQKQKGGLRLDSKAGWQAGGDRGPAVMPGKPDESLLIKAARGAAGVERMPPKETLTDREVAALVRWVKDGAADPRDGAARLGGTTLEEARKWWAFQPVKRPAVPKSDFANPVDAFVAAKLADNKLALSPPADKRTLLRRAAYDLTGLPPTPEEVATFLKDDSPDAFAKVVERLLASPAYGERWGRHWLDLVRYADTAGDNSDHPLPHAWRYRNWVIDAVNRDQPYDEFLREQLAGDLLAAQGPPERYAPRIVATGYLALARRFEHDSDKAMHLTHEDGIDTLGKALLGLTLGCARCHDHKYDAVTARDYYALYGIFESTRFAFAGCEAKQQPRDLVPLVPPAEWDRVVKPYRDRLARLDGDITAAGVFRRAALLQRRAALARSVPKPDVAFAVAEGKPADARIHLRGDPEKLGDAVPRRWLEVLGGAPVNKKDASGRLELANWIASKDNPLTARVMANRVWLHHFGQGLVKTPNDFGTRGTPPTHPELLDWLATEFVRAGWSVKALHRTIMLSATYQQASGPRADAIKVDANNDLYWRFDRRRLSAEELRDSLLVASGRLDRTPGGPHPFPPESAWNYTQHVPFGTFFETDRRSVYLAQVRNRRHPFLGLFDGADPNATTPQRQATTVPTQALYFLNDPFFHAQADALAARVLAKPEAERTGELFRIVFQRPTTERDHEFATAFLGRYAAALAGTPAADRPKAARRALARVLLASNEFLYVE
jgi:mono/diheme cytochrome c family protein